VLRATSEVKVSFWCGHRISIFMILFVVIKVIPSKISRVRVQAKS
jgi:hypothetical protein